MRDNVPLVSKAMTVLGAFSVTKDSGKSSIFMLSFTYGFPLYTEQRRYINFHETTDQSINQPINHTQKTQVYNQYCGRSDCHLTHLLTSHPAAEMSSTRPSPPLCTVLLVR